MPGIWLKIADKQIGPLPPVLFDRYLCRGRISEKDYAWNYDEKTWIQLEHIKTFDPYFKRKSEEEKFGKVVAIGGSKGGVGKNSLVASLALELARAGKKIIAVDADFCDPDLRQWLGIKKPRRTLPDFFNRRVERLEDVIVESSIPNLSVICGNSKSIIASNPLFAKRRMFVNQLLRLDADFVLVDLGPGASYSNVDLFLSCEEKMLVTIPEPSSILSSIRFLHISLLRSLMRSLSFCPVAQILIQQFERSDWHHQSTSLEPLLSKIEKIDIRTGLVIKCLPWQLQPKLIMNNVMNDEELHEGHKMIQSLTKSLNIKVDYLGFIKHHPEYRAASKERRPFLLINSECGHNLKFQEKKNGFLNQNSLINGLKKNSNPQDAARDNGLVKSMIKDLPVDKSNRSVIEQLSD